MLPWLVLGCLEVYLALGYAGLPGWPQLIGELLLTVSFGLLMARGLPSFPGAATTLAPVVPLFSTFASQMPRGLGALPFLVGLLVILGVPLAPLVTRRGLPWWLSAALVVPATLFAHGVYSLGMEVALPGTTAGRLVHDLTWPARLPDLPEPADVGPPVILISVDTLRADRARQMETYKRLAARGASWDSVTSTSSWTLPALGSLQTGTMPVDHGAGCLYDGHCQGLFPHVRTLAMDLADRGYTNVAVMSNPWAGFRSGIERGFHAYADLGNDPPRRLAMLGIALEGAHHQDAEVVVSMGLDWLERLEDRSSFYLWLHLLDPHLPYTHADNAVLQGLTVEGMRNTALLSPAQREALVQAYEREVQVADQQLLRLLDALEASGLLDRAIVVFTSDHGEELFDHGGYEHGHTHHAEVVEVPLAIVAPGLRPGRRTGVASLLDVPSTIRHAVGIPSAGVDLRGPHDPDRIVTAQGSMVLWQSCSARSADRRVLVDDCTEDQRIQRYDLAADPGEHAPLPPDPLDPVQRAAVSVEAPSKGEAVDSETEALRALGYVR